MAGIIPRRSPDCYLHPRDWSRLRNLYLLLPDAVPLEADDDPDAESWLDEVFPPLVLPCSPDEDVPAFGLEEVEVPLCPWPLSCAPD